MQLKTQKYLAAVSLKGEKKQRTKEG